MSLTALVDGDDRSFDHVLLGIKQRLEFLNGERAVGIEDGVDAGHLGSDDAGRGRGRAKRTGRIGSVPDGSGSKTVLEVVKAVRVPRV